jgi:hypothetical protein
MKRIGLLAATLMIAAAPAAAVEQAPRGPHQPQQAASYSFADVYRLTVSGAALFEAGSGAPAMPEHALRIVALPDRPASEIAFSVSEAPQPAGWLLALTGLAFAGWVAAKRLTAEV